MKKLLQLKAIQMVRGDQAAIDEILKALKAAGGNMRAACEELGLGKSSMYRLLDELNARDAIDNLVETKGYKIKGRDKVRGKVHAGHKRAAVPAKTTAKTTAKKSAKAADAVQVVSLGQPRIRVKKISA